MSDITFAAGRAPRSGSGKELFWREAVAAFEAGGRSVSAFCRSRGLKAPTFYAWRLRLKSKGRPSPSPTSPRQHSASPRQHSALPAFLPVVVEPRSRAADESIQVELRGGRVLRLPASTPAARLAEVLHALEGRA
jgi:transposase-like protein